jgi:hypothetical protein
MTYLDEGVERLMWARLGLREDQARDVIGKLEPAVEARIETARAEERAKLEAQLLSDEAKGAVYDAYMRYHNVREKTEKGWTTAILTAVVATLASHPTPDGEEEPCKTCGGSREVPRPEPYIADEPQYEPCPDCTPDGPASPVLGDEERLPDHLKGRPQILVSGTREDWEAVIQTLGYANNPAAEIPGIRLDIKDQVDGGLIGGAP